MCQVIHLADVRTALEDYLDEELSEELSENHFLADDLVSQFDAYEEDEFVHVMEHARRARLLECADDDDAADVHFALLSNIKRAGKSAVRV